MEYMEATRALGERLAAGEDDLAAAGAVQLAIEAWKHLAGVDTAWDRFGLALLDIQARLYSEEVDVVVNAAAPSTDDPELRTAVADLVEQLAQHHERLAADEHTALAQRLNHDAGAQHLRRAAAALA